MDHCPLEILYVIVDTLDADRDRWALALARKVVYDAMRRHIWTLRCGRELPHNELKEIDDSPASAYAKLLGRIVRGMAALLEDLAADRSEWYIFFFDEHDRTCHVSLWRRALSNVASIEYCHLSRATLQHIQDVEAMLAACAWERLARAVMEWVSPRVKLYAVRDRAVSVALQGKKAPPALPAADHVAQLLFVPLPPRPPPPPPVRYRNALLWSYAGGVTPLQLRHEIARRSMTARLREYTALAAEELRAALLARLDAAAPPATDAHLARILANHARLHAVRERMQDTEMRFAVVFPQ